MRGHLFCLPHRLSIELLRIFWNGVWYFVLRDTSIMNRRQSSKSTIFAAVSHRFSVVSLLSSQKKSGLLGYLGLILLFLYLVCLGSQCLCYSLPIIPRSHDFRKNGMTVLKNAFVPCAMYSVNRISVPSILNKENDVWMNST